jgi:acetolactate synthase-1/2/3 large subunit
MRVADLIVETLVANGIDRVFCVPGESCLGLLDALHGRSDIDTVACRHESGAGFMALADARLTGRPGAAIVSRGPGATNAAIAVHTAQQDAIPFILLVGQVACRNIRRDAFQEIDYRQMFGSIAKWVFELADAERTPEAMLRALQTAMTGLPGPVVIAVPEDILTAEMAAPALARWVRVTSAPDAASVREIERLLSRAEQPLVIAGSSVGTEEDRAELIRFLEDWNLPCMVSFRRHDLMPNDHPLYAGAFTLANSAGQMDILNDADLIVVIGARLSDATTQGYTFPHPVRPRQTLVHIHPDAASLGTHFGCDLAVACSAGSLLAALKEPVGSAPKRQDWIDRLTTERKRTSVVGQFNVGDGVPFETVVDVVGQALPKDAIVAVDAGAFAAPIYRVLPFRPPQRLLAPISGAMGFGVPAAVAAGMREPERPIVCFVGDGGFLMTGAELTVAQERRIPLKVIVSENGAYGSIRAQQERDYPGRNVATSFTVPDLELMGRAYGGAVARIASAKELERIPQLLCAPGLQVIIVKTSVEAILPRPAPAGADMVGAQSRAMAEQCAPNG